MRASAAGLVIARAAAALLLLAAAGSGAPAAGQDANLTRIQAMLTKPAVMCGRFEQTKTLVGLRRPVRSSGRFCVAPGKGVLWSTLAPFASSLLLTRDGIIESRDGHVTKQLSAREEPVVGVVDDLLFSLLQGDLGRLAGSFTIRSDVAAQAWNAKLAPKDGGMKRIITAIDVGGASFVHDIAIHEASGDLTEIVFSALATGASAMQPDEARQLGVPNDASPPGGNAR